MSKNKSEIANIRDTFLSEEGNAKAFGHFMAENNNGAKKLDPVSFDAETNTYSIQSGVSAAEINLIIANADPGATVLLLDGTHEFTETILIERDDITFTGESEAGTILNFTFPEGTGGNAIEINGDGKTYSGRLQEDAPAGSNQLVLSDTSELSEGDVLYISLPNTQEYLLENGWTNVSWEDADERPFREMLIRIESIDGNTITTTSPLAYDFEATETRVFTTDYLEDVSISNFTVTSGIADTPNYYDFVNDIPEFENTAVIAVNGADAIDLQNISILDAPSSAFEFRSTIDLTADNLYVNGAHNLGGGGNGYGVTLYEAFDSEITNIDVFNVRHAVLFSSWHAEVGNTVEVNETNRDINFHGSPDINNTVTVETAIMDYDPAQNTGSSNGFWDIVSEGGSSHAMTDVYQSNTVTFKYAEGSEGSETIYAADTGSYIDGNGAQDVLYGGIGEDILIGGTSKDQLSGSDGSDIFVFELGDAYDTISDFSGDVDGDRILINNEDISGFEDLRLTQKDADAYVKYGANSTIILTDTDVASLDAEYFLFNTDLAMV